jgi:hypothetical protein
MILEKYYCNPCDKSFLVIEGGHGLSCPFCKGEVGKIASQNPDIDLRMEMGCLWPSGLNQS